MPDVRLHLGDCLDVMRGMADGSVDAVITDPPAAIGFMGRQWDGDKGGRLAWVAWLAERLAECYRIAKPGARMLCWALPRTSHWTGTAIEDAGWAIEDRLSHLFGQGFPKHKSKLKPACEDWWLAIKPAIKPAARAVPLNIDGCRVAATVGDYNHPGNSERRPFAKNSFNGAFDGSTKPTQAPPNAAGRWPPHVLLTHHADCRCVGEKRVKGSGFSRSRPPRSTGDVYGEHRPSEFRDHADPDGLETVAAWECVGGGLCPVRVLDEQTAGLYRAGNKGGTAKNMAGYSEGWPSRQTMQPSYGDSGGASRFFPTFAWDEADFAPYLYCPKASRSDRGEGNTHPTVKPIKLCEWLVKLICPPGGTVLDPFAGSGSTLVAAIRKGFSAIGIEEDPEYLRIASKRIDEALASCGMTDTGTPSFPDGWLPLG
jgi:hypothetical protein